MNFLENIKSRTEAARASKAEEIKDRITKTKEQLHLLIGKAADEGYHYIDISEPNEEVCKALVSYLRNEGFTVIPDDYDGFAISWAE